MSFGQPQGPSEIKYETTNIGRELHHLSNLERYQSLALQYCVWSHIYLFQNKIGRVQRVPRVLQQMKPIHRGVQAPVTCMTGRAQAVCKDD